MSVYIMSISSFFKYSSDGTPIQILWYIKKNIFKNMFNASNIWNDNPIFGIDIPLILMYT